MRTRSIRPVSVVRTASAAVLIGVLAVPAGFSASASEPVPASSPASASASAGAADPAPAAPAAPAEPLTAAVTGSATPGGPLPTSIRLSEDDSTTTVLVHGMGDAEAERVRENRQFRHSGLQPTGRYARAATELTITVPEGAPQTSVVIGLFGAHAEHNGGVAKDHHVTRLQPGENTVTTPVDGMVHLRSSAAGGSADIELAGGTPVPVFVLGQTTNDALRAEMARLADAPFVTVIGERVHGEFQRSRTGAQILAADVPARVAMWDRSIEITNDVYGLRDDATGVSRKAPHRIHLASPDSASGHYAFATHDRLTFGASGSARDLFVRDERTLWGFWHEIGHTYQAPNYLWSGMMEVTVNISPLHVESRQGWASTVDSPGHLAGLERFFATPVADRDHATSGTNEMLFDHLRRGFGDDFYPRLNQEMRVMAARGESVGLTDDDEKQLFALTAARVADRDLRGFFREWGFPLSSRTAAAMAQLPPLERPIWRNRHSDDMIRERDLGSYAYPTGAIEGVDETVAVGQRRLSTPPTMSDLSDSEETGTVRVIDHTLRASSPGTGAVTVTAVTDDGVREAFSTPVEVVPGSMFQFTGVSSRDIGRLALEPVAHELRFFASSGYPSHDYFPGEEYIGVTVYDELGRERSAFSLEGQDHAHRVAAAFDGSRADDGWYVVVRHREARTRLSWWDAGVARPADAATVRTLRVDGARLVPVASVPGRGMASTVARGLPGGTTDWARVDVRSTQTGTMTVEAPVGTTIADVEVRRTSDDHRRADVATDYDDDRGRVTVSAPAGDDALTFGPGAGDHLRVSFAVDDDTAADSLLDDGRATLRTSTGADLLASTSVPVSTSAADHGALAPLPSAEVALPRGETTEVPVAVSVAAGSLTRPTGTVTVTAPTGTTFAAGQDVIRGRHTAGDLPDGRGMRLTGERSSDGTTYRYTWAPSDDGSADWTSPRHGVLRWSLDVVTPHDAAPGTQSLRHRITGTSDSGDFDARGGTPTRVEGEGGLTAVSPDEPIVVLRGTTTPVPFVVEATASIDRLDGRFDLIAPVGTVFDARVVDDPEEALITEVQAPGGRWVAAPGLIVDSVTLSREGRSAAVQLRSDGALGLGPAWRVRWHAPVAVPASTVLGDADLRWVFDGEADGRAITSRG